MIEKIIKFLQYICVFILFICTQFVINFLLNSNDIITFPGCIITAIILNGAYCLIADEKQRNAEHMLHYYFKQYKLGIYSDKDDNDKERSQSVKC